MRPLGGMLLFATAAAVVMGSAPANAALCGSEKPGNPIVYVTGAAKTYLAALARALYSDAEPITIVWKGASSCVAWDAVLNGTPLTGTAEYWDPSSQEADNQVECELPVLDGGVLNADIAISDVFASTCQPLPNGLPSDIGDFLGPVQPMTFVAPYASSERAISATAAYFVYGFGADSGVPPWTDAEYIYRLDTTSGTLRILAAGIGVPPEKWKGNNANYSGQEITKLTTVPVEAVNKTIGILAGTNLTDSLKLQLKVLAFKHFGQSCAYYPDSTDTSKDKRNVRDGHYALWGPVHVASKIDSKGYPVSEHARRVINYLTGVTPPPGHLDLVQVAATSNLVPSCAMRVKRDREMGPMASFIPSTPCHCAFEKAATGSSSCQPCTTSAECPAASPTCSFGYCESP
ncbi:MAG TPA: hypothetical protein PLI95_17315 [Polyangiaceae bacterium]|mgnify:CR=1 FL=1|nr:hypothetical protein [Polyangiaceae bacterium]